MIDDIGGTASAFNGNGVAQYGIEAAMPKGSGLISRAELDKMDRHERNIFMRMNKYRNMVEFVEVAEEYIEDPVKQVVYSCMMDGVSYRAIGKHVGYSKDKVRQIRDDILDDLSQSSQFSHICNYLKFWKKIM